MRVGQSQCRRPVVHFAQKRCLTAALACDSHRSVVARFQQQAVKRVAQRERLALPQIYRRAFYLRVFFFDGVRPVEIPLTERHQCSHNLGR